MKPFLAMIIPVGSKPPTEPPPVGGDRPEIDNDLPLFPFQPIIVPPGGTWPGEPPPIDSDKPHIDLPINLPPSENGYWVEIYIPGVGWKWVPVGGEDPNLPDNTLPPTAEPK